MDFDPNNKVVKLCLQGMAMEEADRTEEAAKLFLQAWNASSNDFEKFLAAHYVARHQNSVADRLKWFETALQLGSRMNDIVAQSAFPSLYMKIARCQEELGEPEKARKSLELAASFKDRPADTGPFYHGTKAELRVGDLLTAGGSSNYRPGLKMNHIYFTALMNGAGLAAALAKGDGREQVYQVEPTGNFENDPNVTDKKFPGNPTRSYRSSAPLKVMGEVTDRIRTPPEEIQKWRQTLANHKGEIIN